MTTFKLSRVLALVIVASVTSLLVVPVSTFASVNAFDSYAIGSSVDLPPGFDFNWISSAFMKHSGVARVSVLKVVATRTPRAILATNGPKSYEVDALVRACADAKGFKAVVGSHSADIADAVAAHLYLLPEETRGMDSVYFGFEELSVTGTAPTLLHGRLFTLAPTMKPNECFTGVASYAVPIQIGSPSSSTSYSVILASSTFPMPGDAIMWTPPPKR